MINLRIDIGVVYSGTCSSALEFPPNYSDDIMGSSPTFHPHQSHQLLWRNLCPPHHSSPMGTCPRFPTQSRDPLFFSLPQECKALRRIVPWTSTTPSIVRVFLFRHLRELKIVRHINERNKVF